MKVQFILISIFATGALAGSGRGHPQDLHTYASIAACAHETSVFSCENTTPIKNTCCSPTPGGLVLATQFWDTYTGLEHLGQKLPQGSWGIHGLWPDNCDGCVLTHCIASRTQAQIFFYLVPSNSTATFQDNSILIPLLLRSRMALLFLPTKDLELTPSSRNLKGLNSWTIVRLHVQILCSAC